MKEGHGLVEVMAAPEAVVVLSDHAVEEVPLSPSYQDDAHHWGAARPD